MSHPLTIGKRQHVSNYPLLPSLSQRLPYLSSMSKAQENVEIDGHCSSDLVSPAAQNVAGW